LEKLLSFSRFSFFPPQNLFFRQKVQILSPIYLKMVILVLVFSGGNPVLDPFSLNLSFWVNAEKIPSGHNVAI